jgi:hypothetical protein
MPIVTRDRRGKRARETSEELGDPDKQLELEATEEDLVVIQLLTLNLYSQPSYLTLIRYIRHSALALQAHS